MVIVHSEPAAAIHEGLASRLQGRAAAADIGDPQPAALVDMLSRIHHLLIDLLVLAVNEVCFALRAQRGGRRRRSIRAVAVEDQDMAAGLHLLAQAGAEFWTSILLKAFFSRSAST